MASPHTPTPETRHQVETLAGLGLTQDSIARVIGLSRPALFKHYALEIERGVDLATQAVSEALFNKALGESQQSVTAAIFWLKCRAQWREPAHVHEVGGVNGGPVKLLLRVRDFREDPERTQRREAKAKQSQS